MFFNVYGLFLTKDIIDVEKVAGIAFRWSANIKVLGSTPKFITRVTYITLTDRCVKSVVF